MEPCTVNPFLPRYSYSCSETGLSCLTPGGKGLHRSLDVNVDNIRCFVYRRACFVTKVFKQFHSLNTYISTSVRLKSCPDADCTFSLSFLQCLQEVWKPRKFKRQFTTAQREPEARFQMSSKYATHLLVLPVHLVSLFSYLQLLSHLYSGMWLNSPPGLMQACHFVTFR